MTLKGGVYILECIPKKEGMKEGIMLFEFLKMEIPEKVELKFIKSKNHFFDELNKNNFGTVHISCHGKYYDENFCLQTSNGYIYPEEFCGDDHLKGRNVVITGCSLGRKSFAGEFLERTGAESLIAPMNDIDFLDSAMWCVNFYYIILKKDYTFGNAFDYMKENFYVKGAMQMWENIKVTK
jgi:hypothetical protein